MQQKRRWLRLGLAAVMASAVAGGLCAAAAGGTTRHRPADPVAVTDRGLVRGVEHGDHTTYNGLPYAAPPVGARRWQDPQPARAWTGVRDASRPGPQCAQAKPDGSAGFAGSEDCLYLNVTTPARPGGRRPVMVWLHGGAGTGQGSDYDPGRLAAQGNAVVITVNYRLGVFSFFGHPELHGAGDFGYADQRAALRWARRNAVFFGGDPHNVTLFGESSGALSACSQLAAPAAKGLFNKVILQSGSCLLRIPKNGVVPGGPAYDQWAPRSQVETRGVQLGRAWNCTVPGQAVACLRRLPTAQLLTPANTQQLGYTAYGIPSLPVRPGDALLSGHTIHVPVLIGTNLDEMRLFISAALAGGLTLDAGAYHALLADTFGSAAPRVEAAYPVSRFPSAALAWAAVQTDAGFACTGLRAAEAFSTDRPVYFYEFADEHAPNVTGSVEAPGFPIGAAHTFEFASLFDFPRVPLTAAQQRLSAAMIDYWTSFARTGDPNGWHRAGWPRFTAVDHRELTLAPNQVAGTSRFNAEHHCDFWRHIPAA